MRRMKTPAERLAHVPTPRPFHISMKGACGQRWRGLDGLTHVCQYHVKETGACVCPCSATREKLSPK